MPELVEYARVRGKMVALIALHQGRTQGSGMLVNTLRTVIDSLFPELDKQGFQGCISWLQDMGLVEHLIDDDVPLQFADETQRVKLTRAGAAVASRAAQMNGIKIPE